MMDGKKTHVLTRNDGERMHERIVTAIAVLTEEQRRPPTLREIGAHAGATSRGHIFHHLQTLVAQGRLLHAPGGVRCYMLPPAAHDILSTPPDKRPEIVQMMDAAVALEATLRDWTLRFEAAGRDGEANLATILTESANVLVSGLALLPDIKELE